MNIQEQSNSQARPAHFGHWLKARRMALGLTQKDLARLVGCSKITIEKLESGERRPSGQVATLLAEHLEVPSGERRAFIEFARADLQHSTPDTQNPADSTLAPWRSLRPNNLPAQMTGFIGREEVMAEVTGALQKPDLRLLTLTGPPGIGKTRLSLQVATQMLGSFRDGVFFVPLAAIREKSRVVSALAQTLDVKEAGAQPLIETLKETLAGREVLLVLDNFEQVIPAGPLVAELLQASPGLTALVTSREVLHVYGEYDFPVPLMEIPPTGVPMEPAVLLEYETVRLFVERAVAARRDFSLTPKNAQAVAAICARLEGLPLAVELAAAQVRNLSPQAILEELQSRLRLLVAGPQDLTARQQTLRGAIDWSYDLLTEEEGALFRRLGVFVGGFTAEAVEAVAASQANESGLLASLADKSLLKSETGDDGDPRYSMLETIREYALERLDACGETADARRAHLLYFLDLAERAAPKLSGPEQAVWLNRLEREHDNLRAALDASEKEAEGGDGDAAGLHLRLAGALHRFWFTRGYLQEGRARLDAAVRFAMEDEASAKVLLSAGDLARLLGDYDAARRLTEKSLEIRRKLGDRERIAMSLNNLGIVFHDQGDIASARSFFEECLAIRRESGDKQGIGMVLNNLGILAYAEKDYPQAEAMYEESLAIRREVGNKRAISIALNNLAYVALATGDVDRAFSLVEESLQTKMELGDKFGIASCLEGLGRIAAARGLHERAAALWAFAMARWAEMGSALPATDLADYEAAIGAVRAELGEEAFERASSQGSGMSWEEAIAYALGEGDAP